MLSNQQKVNHLLRRAAFGPGWKYADVSLSTVQNNLFRTSRSFKKLVGKTDGLPKPDKKNGLDPERRQKLREINRKHKNTLMIDWMESMAFGPSPLRERIALFWHGHFACRIDGVRKAHLHLDTLRHYALGNFRDILLAIAKDPAMIDYLNTKQNRKGAPNENFSRELFELFTLGRGHYTEQDIKEAARAFTGWSYDFDGRFILRKMQHDYSTKTVFGESGNFNGDDIIDLVLKQKQCARFIAEKMYRYFVNPTLIESEVIELTDVLFDSNYDIDKTIRFLFTAEWFYSVRNVGAKIKSPVDYLVFAARELKMKIRPKDKFLERHPFTMVQHVLGQVLMNPPNVAGWPGHEAWIDSSTLMMRMSIMNYVVVIPMMEEFPAIFKDEIRQSKKGKERKLFAAIKELNASYQHIYQDIKSKNTNAQIDELQSRLLPVENTEQYDSIKIDHTNGWNKKLDAVVLLMHVFGLPEYQLC